MAFHLSRFQLVNWHLISNSHIVDLAPKYNMIVGANRSGKSTIIDAFTTCLLFNTSDYNTSATDKSTSGRNSSSKRTDIGYVRGFVLDDMREDGGFLEACRRKGEVVSYIIIEVEMPGSHLAEKAVFGIEQFAGKSCVETGDIKKQWFIIRNHGLKELNLFRVNEKGEKHPRRLNEVVAGFDPSDVIMADRSTMQKHFSTYLGLGYQSVRSSGSMDAFISAFNKMKSLKIDANVRNSDQIVRNVILKREEVRIDGMKAERERSAAASAELAAQEARLRELTAIIDEASALEDAIRQVDYAKVALTLLEAKNAAAKFAAADEKMAQTNMVANEAEERTDEAWREYQNLDTAKRRLETSPEYSGTRPILERIESLEKRIQQSTDAQSKFSIHLKELCEVARAVNEAYGSTKVNDMLFDSFAAGEEITSDDIDRLCSRLNDFAKELSEILGELRPRAKEAEAKRDRCQSEIEALEQGKIMPDNQDCEVVKRLIRADFHNSNITDIPVYLCELIEFTDERWAPAAEQYMGGTRFHICVAPENYERACRVEREYRNEDKRHRGNVWIADLAKASRDMQGKDAPEEGTLASIIKTDNPYARAYVDRAFGCVYLVEDTITQRDKNKTMLAPDGSVYIPGRHGSQRPITRLVVGSAAKKERLAALKAELQGLISDAATLGRQVSACSSANLKLHSSICQSAISTISNEWQRANSLRRLEKELEEARKDLKRYDNMPVQQQINKYREQIQEAKDKWSKLKAKAAALRDTASVAKYEYERAEAACDELHDKAKELRTSKSAEFAGAEGLIELWKNEKHTKSVATLIKHAEASIEEYSLRASELSSSLKMKQERYTESHKQGSMRTGGLKDMAEYRAAQMMLASIEVPALRKKMEIARDNAREIFFSNVIGNLATQIRSAQDLFRDRNKWLALCPVDNNVFQIKAIQPAAAFKEQYEAIMALGTTAGPVEQYSVGEASEDRDAHMAIADALFDELCKEPDAEKSIYLDYRTYCRFGIEVISVDPDSGEMIRGSAKKFEDWLGIGSGGQVELPLYIILGVALSNACSSKRKSISESLNASDSIRLCVLDEALMRCDGEFTKKVLHFLTDTLGMQLITLAPADQYDRLSYDVERVLLVEQDPKRSLRYIRQFHYADYENAISA